MTGCAAVCSASNVTHSFKRFRRVAESAHYLRHIRPSVRMYQCGSHGTDLGLHEI